MTTNLTKTLQHTSTLRWVVGRVLAVNVSTPSNPMPNNKLDVLVPSTFILRAGYGTGGSSSVGEDLPKYVEEDKVLHNVSYLDSYKPLVGDTVHMLVQEDRGALALGRLGII